MTEDYLKNHDRDLTNYKDEIARFESDIVNKAIKEKKQLAKQKVKKRNRLAEEKKAKNKAEAIFQQEKKVFEKSKKSIEDELVSMERRKKITREQLENTQRMNTAMRKHRKEAKQFKKQAEEQAEQLRKQAEERRTIVLNMQKFNMPAAQIAAITAMPIEEVQQIITQAEEQALAQVHEDEWAVLE
ncbi:MAG: hypothetical protein HKP45_09330 [Winogradskyella sp.]|nr:hypothetical protein [Winogradskyella sp.]